MNTILMKISKSFALTAIAIFIGFAQNASAARPEIETTTGNFDPKGCEILKARDGYKRGFIYKKAGHWGGKPVAVLLKAFRGGEGLDLDETMKVYKILPDGSFSGPVSKMYMKFDGSYCEGCENILQRPAFQEYRFTMKQLKKKFGKLALSVKLKDRPEVCYTWKISDPTKRYD